MYSKKQKKILILEHLSVHSCLSPHVHTHLQVPVWCGKLLDQPFDSAVDGIKGFKTFKMQMDNDAP